MRRTRLTLLIALAAWLAPALSRAQQSAYQPQTLPSAYAVEARPLPVAVPATDPTAVHPFPFRQVSAQEPIQPATAERSLPLAPRSSSSKHSADRPAPASASGAIGSVVGSLAVVLGLFLVVVWFSRRFSPAGSALLPKEVVELLGRTPLGSRQSMQLVRVGQKLLLVSLSPAGAETLTEITDPVEVEHLAALCRRGKPDSATASFNQILGQLATEQPAPRTRTRGAT